MDKYENEIPNYTKRCKHGKGQAANSYPPLKITFDGRAVNRDYSIKYEKKGRRHLTQGIYKRRSRQKKPPLALWSRNNGRKRHSSPSNDIEQRSKGKRRRGSSQSRRRVSTEERQDIYSDISEYDLHSNPGEISDSQRISDQSFTNNENHRRQETSSQWQTWELETGNEIVYGHLINSRTSHFDTEQGCDDMNASVSLDTHDGRSPKTGAYTDDFFPLPIMFQSFEGFSCNEKEEFIARALAELVALRKGNDKYLFGVEMPVFRDRLYSRGIQFESYKSYKEIMSSLPANFGITHDEKIEPKTDVKICERYTQNPLLKDCDCHDLHICKFVLVGRCLPDQSCKFNHDIFKPHNKHVLKLHFLHKMKSEYIGEIVSYVHNRNATTSPTVCKFYNNEGGCKQQNYCQHLHVCLHFVTKTCKFGARCKRDHNFNSSQSKCILNMYGLSEYEYNLEVLFDLIGKNLKDGVIKTRKHLKKNIEMTNDKGVDGSASTFGSSQDMKTVSKTPDRYWNFQPKYEEKTKSNRTGSKLKNKQGGRGHLHAKRSYLDKNIAEKRTDQAHVSRFPTGNSSIDFSRPDKKYDKAGHAKDDPGPQHIPAVGMLTTHLSKENGSVVENFSSTHHFEKELKQTSGNIQENTRGRKGNKQSDTFPYKSNTHENTKDDNHEEMSKAIAQIPLQETPSMKIVDKVDAGLDNCQGNLKAKPTGFDGHKNYDKTSVHLPSGGYGFVEEKKQHIRLIGKDNFCREKSEQILDDTELDVKIIFQHSPNHDCAFIEQDDCLELAEEGEIIEDEHAENSREPYQYSHVHRETKNETNTTLILTYGTTEIGTECLENDGKTSANLRKKATVMVDVSIRNIHPSDIRPAPIEKHEEQDISRPNIFSDQRLSGQLRLTGTGNHKSGDVAGI